MARPTSLSPSELRAIVRVLEQARHVDIGLSASEWAAVARAEMKLKERLAHQPEATPAASGDAPPS